MATPGDSEMARRFGLGSSLDGGVRDFRGAFSVDGVRWFNRVAPGAELSEFVRIRNWGSFYETT